MTATLAALCGAIGASIVWVAVCWRLMNQRDRAMWEAAHLRVQPAHLQRHHDGDLPEWRRYSRRLPDEIHYDGPGAA